MFHLLQSIWMLAAAGIIIPLVIHFWNRKKGKTLQVGSISLLAESYKQQAKNVHLQELLLLLLRCTLILLVAFLLSNPVWQEQPDPKNQNGWILVEKAGLLQTYARFKPVIDSLTGQQYEFHYFDAGFKKDNLATALKNNTDTSVQNTNAYWSLLSSLDQEVPATLPVYLFTSNSLQRFSGTRSRVAMNLHWYTYTAKDSVSQWLANAYVTTADSIRLVAATSQPSGTAYSYTNLAVAAQQTAGYTVQTDNKTISVSFQNGTPVPVDTASFAITICTDKYTNDASYVKAAVEAIRQFSKRKIKLSLVSNPADILPKQDWIFWLSDQPVSPANGSNIFVYEKGKAEAVESSVLTVNRGNEQPALHKRILYKSTASGSAQTIWQDGFGNPVLELEKGNTAVYHFFSRFDPSWTDLPWSNVFPQMIYDLIWNQPVSSGDNRVMDDRQIQPITFTGNKVIAKDNTVTHDLAPFFWIAAFIIFFTERFITFRTRKEKING